MESVGRFVSTERGIPTSHNYYIGIVAGLVSRSVSSPVVPKRRIGPHISATPKPRDQELRGVVDQDAALPVVLHAGSLGAGEQGIRHESVIGEHGVVSTHVCFGRAHTLFGQGPTIHPHSKIERLS